MKVKICGITNYQDAALALSLGADALGFNFYPSSPRYIRLEDAKSIIRRLPPFVTHVGVFVNERSPHDVSKKASAAHIHCLQLHGGESPQFCRDLSPWPIIKAFRVAPDFDLGVLDTYPLLSAVLLDHYSKDGYGGTGKTIDWNVAVKAKRYGRIILAGGLNRNNVASAIRLVKPYAVDVCSGVEKEPGKKDRALLQAFMNEVERARREIRR